MLVISALGKRGRRVISSLRTALLHSKTQSFPSSLKDAFLPCSLLFNVYFPTKVITIPIEDYLLLSRSRMAWTDSAHTNPPFHSTGTPVDSPALWIAGLSAVTIIIGVLLIFYLAIRKPRWIAQIKYVNKNWLHAKHGKGFSFES